jgi:hypothetical protein
MDEWKRIFDKFDIESDGIADGKIPVKFNLSCLNIERFVMF